MATEEQKTLFQRWLKDHTGLILKVVRGSAEAPHDREDLFQDVLVNLWASISRFRGEAKETTWIYRVAFNTALGWQRNEHRRRRKHESFSQILMETTTSVDSTASTDGQEVVEKLYVAIRRLTKVDATLALMHLDGLSYQEMSDVLGISENYIGVKLNRIRKQLADSLQGDCDEI